MYGLGFSTEHHLTKVHTHTHTHTDGCLAFHESGVMARANFTTDLWSVLFCFDILHQDRFGCV